MVRTKQTTLTTRTILALSAAAMTWAGVTMAQQPQPARDAAEAKPLPRRPEGVTEFGDPPADYGSGASAIRQVVDESTDAARPAAAARQQDAKPLSTSDVSLGQAHAILEAAAAKATALNTKMDIAIVDAGGNLKAFARQDGAWLGSIDISIKKAKTARFFDMPTGEIGKLSQPGGPLYNIEHSNGGLITFPGGVPLHGADGTTVIGAIGVSGSTVENDHEVAAAGAAALKGAAPRAQAAQPGDAAPAAARTGPAERIDGRAADRAVEPTVPARGR